MVRTKQKIQKKIDLSEEEDSDYIPPSVESESSDEVSLVDSNEENSILTESEKSQKNNSQSISEEQEEEIKPKKGKAAAKVVKKVKPNKVSQEGKGKRRKSATLHSDSEDSRDPDETYSEDSFCVKEKKVKKTTKSKPLKAQKIQKVEKVQKKTGFKANVDNSFENSQEDLKLQSESEANSEIEKIPEAVSQLHKFICNEEMDSQMQQDLQTQFANLLPTIPNLNQQEDQNPKKRKSTGGKKQAVKAVKMYQKAKATFQSQQQQNVGQIDFVEHSEKFISFKVRKQPKNSQEATFNSIAVETTIQQVKELIMSQWFIPVNDQELFGMGKKLENEKTIAQYQIPNDYVFQLYIKSQAQQNQPFIQPQNQLFELQENQAQKAVNEYQFGNSFKQYYQVD